MRHPYVGLPDQQFWKKEPGVKDGSLLDPITEPPFKIAATDRIVTLGSCFAQHVARFMSNSGFNHHITEQAHPIMPKAIAQKHNYGLFAARYGNVYTAKQFLQLLHRAYGQFAPRVDSWVNGTDGTVVDPFRPQIQPAGFLSEKELQEDRRQHFACVRAAVEEMDVLVCTLGLTEAWVDTHDGAVFPIAPGIAGGKFNPDDVAFKNFDEIETYDDMHSALSLIREIRPDVRIILTVSPVALNATYEPRHVLQSTVWSKAVLRIVAEKCAQKFKNCVYFPSYEIITSPHARGQYFASDCREVTPEGVKHVMKLFLRHFADVEGTPLEEANQLKNVVENQAQQHMREMEEKMEVLCDEAAIDNA